MCTLSSGLPKWLEFVAEGGGKIVLSILNDPRIKNIILFHYTLRKYKKEKLLNMRGSVNFLSEIGIPKMLLKHQNLAIFGNMTRIFKMDFLPNDIS